MLLDSTCRQNAMHDAAAIDGLHAMMPVIAVLSSADAIAHTSTSFMTNDSVASASFMTPDRVHHQHDELLLFAFHENASPQMMQQHATFDSCAEAAQHECDACLSANMTKPYAGICQPDASFSHVLVHHSTGHELHLT